ncbi:S8 family serine peptidase [Arthrobacter tecti]
MSKSYRRNSGKAVLASLTGLVLASSMWAPASAVEAPDGAPTAEGIELKTLPPGLKISENLNKAAGDVAVFVQFEGEGAFARTQSDAVQSGRKAPEDRSADVKKIREATQAKAKEVVAAVSGKELYVTSNTIPGVAVQGDVEAIRALAARPDVVKISRLTPKVPTNKGGVIDTEALNTWAGDLGETGDGVTIAIIDTGVDYTHAGFGGPGDIATFDAASAAVANTPETPPNTDWYDEAKYVGGWDLVGDTYNADPGGAEPFPYQPTPMPDANPIDCQSHGSHVAGTAAGYGVDSEGNTFEGDYSTLTEDAVNDMRIGPGTAPEAQIVSLRVFGCAGSSLVVGEALDLVLDPNGDGNFEDRSNVVNMSLGSNFPIPDDPEVDILNNLTAQGVLSVVSSGNDGDIYDIGGTPGSAKSALTVANSIGSQITLDRIDILAPPAEATEGPASGQYSVNFDYQAATEDQLNGTVVLAPEANRFGCEAFAPGTFDGEWVWLQWEEDGAFPCGSGVRFDNVEAGGGAGVILDSPRDVFDAGIAGNDSIPGAQFNRESSERLRAEAATGELQVQLNPEYIAASSGPSNALDTLNPSSSRGVHGSYGVVKPDVAAPGTQIGSVAVGTGNGGSVKTGTSMSAPNVAGIAALVYAATEFNAYEVKNAIMNTATADVTVEAGGDVAYAPNRTGSGRVNALNAVGTDAIAYDSEDAALVTVNFGVVEIGADAYSATRKISVRNYSDQPHTYTAEYLAATEIPGVVIDVPDQPITVNGGETVEFDITMTIADPAAMVKAIDPAAEVTHTITSLEPDLDVTRQYIAQASGRVELTSATTNTLRVPVHAAPKPASDMSAEPRVQYLNGSDLEELLTLSGRGLSQGGAPGEMTSYTSLVSPFVLGEESGRLTGLPLDSLNALDLKAVGAASTVPGILAAGGDPADGILNIGISTWDNWSVPTGTLNFTVELDTNNDEVPDFLVQSFREPPVDLDLFLVSALDAEGNATGLTLVPANGVDGATDTNTFDTNVITIPIPVATLGLELGSTNSIQYKVRTISSFTVNTEGDSIGEVDATEWIDFNITDPSLWFAGATGAETSFIDADGASIGVTRDRGVAKENILLLHHHNPSGAKEEIVPIQVGQKKFTDIARADHRDSIVQLEQLAITDGYSEANGTFTFRPFEPVNRDVMAAFMYRFADVGIFAAPGKSPFADLNGPADPGADTAFFYKEMTWMESADLSNGYVEPNGLPTYRPLTAVNRDVMAAFMYRYASEYCDIPVARAYDGTDSPFDDIPRGFVFEKEVSWMSEAGISFGWEENGRTEFRPYVQVTREQMAAFMIRLLDYVDDNGGCAPGSID